MIKRYFLGFLTLLAFSILVTRQYEHYTHSTAAKREHGSNASIAGANTPDTANNTEQTERDYPGWHLLFQIFGWPNGIGVWALFLTLMAIAEQSVATAKQAELARKALILQFRPQLHIRTIKITEENDSLTAHIIIVNKGGTPAHVIGGGSVTLEWVWRHSSNSHIATVPMGSYSLTAGTVITMSINMIEDRLMYSISKDEARKPNPGMQMHCTGGFIYKDDNGIPRGMAFSRFRDEFTQTWSTDTNPENEYAD